MLKVHLEGRGWQIRDCFIILTWAPAWRCLHHLNITSQVAREGNVWLSCFAHTSLVRQMSWPCLSSRRWEEQFYHVPGRRGLKILVKPGDPRGREAFQRLSQYRCKMIRHWESILSIGRKRRAWTTTTKTFQGNYSEEVVKEDSQL